MLFLNDFFSIRIYTGIRLYCNGFLYNFFDIPLLLSIPDTGMITVETRTNEASVLCGSGCDVNRVGEANPVRRRRCKCA
jgi:hypothetical protein